jgi:L-aminopeptidase/D-esterase-like protein
MSASLGAGWRIGHYSNHPARTGCTVLLPPRGMVASCDIRGASPSSRELALLDTDRRLTEVHAIVLTGGSAFGLAAADGVVAWLAERGIGYRTAITPVPIVPAAVIFDLGEGSDARPGPGEGRAACDAAVEGDVATGRVGAGTGATVGKWAGPEHSAPGGLGIASRRARGLEVAALVVVNAVGDVVAEDGSVIRGTSAPEARREGARMTGFLPGPSGAARGVTADAEIPPSTVLAVVATDFRLDKRDVRWLAARGSDGITRSVQPAHTRYDGDVVFAASRLGGAGGSALDVLGELATEAVAAAVRAAVT